MGELISLDAHRAARRRLQGPVRPRARARLYLDLACPFTYLVAERIERSFSDVTWIPAFDPALAFDDAQRRLAEERAVALRMPLVWPEHRSEGVSAAMRVAGFAADQGRGGPFVLAASRLAFCGGFDLDDPEILAEAAAAAGLTLEDCFEAARDRGRDGEIEQAGRRLLAGGAARLPVLQLGQTLHCGEGRVDGALATARYISAATV